MKPIGKYIVIDEIMEEISTDSGILLTGEDTKDLRYKKGVVVMPGMDVDVVGTQLFLSLMSLLFYSLVHFYYKISIHLVGV